jgi:hypothetical protein
LFFRLVIKRPKTVSTGPYFASISPTGTTAPPSTPMSVSDPTNVKEVSASPLAGILAAKDTSAQPVIGPVRDQPLLPSVISADEKQNLIDPRRTRLLHVLNGHRMMLAEIAFNQCSVAFARSVICSFYGPPIRNVDRTDPRLPLFPNPNAKPRNRS